MTEGRTGGDRVGNRQLAAAIIASVLGWSLDLFDLFILLYVAPVIGRLFFPSTHPTLSLAAVYASFAVTLLMRPVGSAFFGSYADRHGRKGAMMLAVIGVGVATAAFGLLPTVEVVGVLAPILFLILRLIQGVFVGGVVASTHTIGTETVPARWRGTLSGFIGGGGAGIGALIASIAYYITSSVFPGDAFATWGWRCMFFTGILSSVLGLFIFNALEESPLWKQIDRGKAAEHAPLRTLFSQPHLNTFLVNLLITVGGGVGYYLTSGYMPAFLRVVLKLPNPTTSALLIVGSLVTIFAAITVGALSDWLGRKKTYLLFGVLNVVLLPILYLSLAHQESMGAVWLYSLAIAFLGNAAYAPTLIFLNERFPTALRASGTGLSWNVGFAIGGLMPTFVSLTSGSVEGLPVALAVFLVGGFIIYLIGAIVIPETKGQFR
ncbi:MAG TPA: MFS transporter [Stellaceae bacterium]|nr:MFS transporter [Stellaceae bacterium]